MSKASAKSAAKKAAAAVARAYRSSLGGGNYGAAIAAKASKALEADMVKQLGAMTLGMHAKTPKRKLSKAEKKARGRVLAAHRASAARAARLPGKKRKGKKKAHSAKKRSKVAARKKVATRTAAAPRAAKKTSSKKGPKMMTADAVIKAAATGALKTWACQGPRRTGCGSGGTRVVNAKGSFKRIRPPRFMAG